MDVDCLQSKEKEPVMIIYKDTLYVDWPARPNTVYMYVIYSTCKWDTFAFIQHQTLWVHKETIEKREPSFNHQSEDEALKNHYDISPSVPLISL